MSSEREIVVGPPGCGKTTTLLGMVEKEIENGTSPDSVGYVSFTKRAATEAVERACAKFRLTPRDLPNFRTLHSTCFRALGIGSGDVLEGKKLREFGDWLGVEFSTYVSTEEGSTAGFTQADRALFMENLARVRRVPLRQQFDEYHDDLTWSFVDYVSRGLEKFKRDRNLVDYTDMLERFTQSTWAPRVEVLFVDESQDLSLLQWEVVSRLSHSARRVVIAGDDDQAIYKWAGAAVDYFVNMPGHVRVLGKSWRVPRSVQIAANDIISRVKSRREKDWSPKDEDGVVSRVASVDQIDFLDGEILILARNNVFLRPLEADLRRDGVLYEYKGRSSVSQDILDAVRLWEHLRKGNKVEAKEVSKVYEYMSAGVGYARGSRKLPGFSSDDLVGIPDLRERGGLLTDDIWHRALDRIPPDEVVYMLKILRRGEKLTGRPRVRLSTIHGSKGGEADHVVLLTDVARRTHDEFYQSPEDEARVWYVAATRAKSRLSVVSPSSSRSYDV